jgi:Bestrophin, RFP-TM, chloride channel
MKCWTQLVVFLAAAALASAFVVPKSNHAPGTRFVSTPSTTTRTTTELFGNTQQAGSADDPLTTVFGEDSRRYRRTVFTHDDWVRHRSPNRFWRNVQTFFVSGIYKNIGNEVAVVTAVATFVVIWNALLGGYTDFSGVQHEAVIQNSLLPKLGLPLAPFTLSSPSLGLLLGTNNYACLCSKLYNFQANLVSLSVVSFFCLNQCSARIHRTNVGTKRERTGE